jgi:hypothetical protein
MSDLFNEIWMKRYQNEWNKDSEITSTLQKISFNSIIGYGFPDELDPRGRIIVEQGKVIDAGPYMGENLNWDLRAKENHWYDWLKREVGNTGLGLAYSTGKLTFLSGDYKSMIRNPDMLKPFIKSFSAMGRVFSR